ncbi:MAG TPA: tyrosine-type recombinase/integrase [Candidatus Sulfotelmatobacter sp.]|nr:tyrosine-type recombinase/integrase [Candidatus Sulfotelmatobacter sp.]
MGKTWGERLTEKAVWHVVREYAGKAGIEKLAPHDLRRTCARLCHTAGGELEQIQFLLGHISIQTTERYLGCKQRLPTIRDLVVACELYLATLKPVASTSLNQAPA